MTRWPLRQLSVLVIMVTLVAAVISLAQYLPRIEMSVATTLALIWGAASVVMALTFIYMLIVRQESLPGSHNVAIVGFPQSGKTTLIISLFGETFAGKILPLRLTPRGTKTIERINESLERLQRGQALGPTKDQDRFGFRADVTVRRFPFPRTYKVEFGDFPGVDSQTYSEDYGPWLHNTEFFKWAVDSDAMIFVIDLGRYLSRDELRTAYIARISSALRAAWQHFLDVNEHRIREVRRHPVVLTFTKADLFGVEEDPHDWDRFEKEIAKLGFGDEIPPIQEIDQEALILGKARVMQDFAELIQYFKGEARTFRVLFTSSFGLADGKRLGIGDLLQAVLPH